MLRRRVAEPRRRVRDRDALQVPGRRSSDELRDIRRGDRVDRLVAEGAQDASQVRAMRDRGRLRNVDP